MNLFKKILSILILLIGVIGFSQTQEELERKKEKLQKEISEKQKELTNVKDKEKSVKKLLTLQQEKIALKEKLINTTSYQTKIIGDNIYKNQRNINQLRDDLRKLKKDYASMILKSYKTRSTQSRAMFLLSAENFKQAYKRLQYMKQYSSYRKMQGLEIKEKTSKLNHSVEKLSTQKKEKETVLEQEERVKRDLVKEKLDQEKIANALKKSKAQIAAEISKKQKETKKIDAQIKKLIRDAIAKANREAAAAKAKANPSTTTKADTKAIESSAKIVLTPEGQLISDNFKANKGRLPWPVEKGAITMGYGKQKHPVYNLTIENSGLEITTETGSNARAVFGGVVTSVAVLSPLVKAVFVQHGDYFTVYQNLTTVNVAVGDKVSAKQVLGKIRTQPDGKTVLKFMITQNENYNNPESWISR